MRTAWIGPAIPAASTAPKEIRSPALTPGGSDLGASFINRYHPASLPRTRPAARELHPQEKTNAWRGGTPEAL
jgi:hypothetical protein